MAKQKKEGHIRMRIDTDLLEKAQGLAADRKTTLTQLITDFLVKETEGYEPKK